MLALRTNMGCLCKDLSIIPLECYLSLLVIPGNNLYTKRQKSGDKPINYHRLLLRVYRLHISFRRPSSANMNVDERFLKKIITPAIRGKTCPICLGHIEDHKAAVITVCMHPYCVECIRKWSCLSRKCPLCNAQFNSWFFNINLSARTFHRERLSALNENKKIEAGLGQRDRLAEQRVIRRLRHGFNRGTRPLPQLRSFGRPGSESHDVVAERILQWRASIYSRCLQAVPLSSSNNGPQENMSRNNVVKERILQRIEPWIRRELMAILQDSDPSVIVHVVTSTYISSLEKKINVPSGSISAEDDYVAPLRPFLHERANMFWHELRCFAESSLTLETYDRVAQYNRSE